MSKDRDDRHGADLAAALRDPNVAIINLRLSAADEIDSLAIELEWVRNALRASQMGEARSNAGPKMLASSLEMHMRDELNKAHAEIEQLRAATAQSDAEPVRIVHDDAFGWGVLFEGKPIQCLFNSKEEAVAWLRAALAQSDAEPVAWRTHTLKDRIVIEARKLLGKNFE